jgi:hypothetical protein
MASGPVTNDLLDNALTLMSTAVTGELNGASILLWINGAWVPSHTDDYTDYNTGAAPAQEAAWAGYARQVVLTWTAPGAGLGIHRQIVGATVAFLNSSGATVHAIGYAVVSSGLLLLGAVAFSAPLPIADGDSLPVIPVLTAVSEVA